jgi:glutamate-1-semialdehyde 2,1-aminomutase
VKNFADVHQTNQDKFRSFYKRVLEHGVFLSPSPYEANFISSAHTMQDLKKTASVLIKVIQELETH